MIFLDLFFLKVIFVRRIRKPWVENHHHSLTTILVRISLVHFSPGIFPMGRNLMAHPLVNTWYSKADHGLMDGRLLKPPIFVCKCLGIILETTHTKWLFRLPGTCLNWMMFQFLDGSNGWKARQHPVS